MFISFGMFIGLIILTIIMIALIIYLTFTSGNKQSRHKKTLQAEEAARIRLAQNSSTTSDQSINSVQTDSTHQDSFKQVNESENQDYQESIPDENPEEDYALHVLPYPKDDDFK